MKSKKAVGCLIMLLVVTQFLQNASAIPVGGSLYGDPCTATFGIGSGSATVNCEVYKYTSGEFIYTYQIFNQDSGIGLSFFSVAILEGASAWSPGVDSDPISGYVEPVPGSWTVVGSPPQSVNCLFADTIDNAEGSALLWFVSDHAPGSGKGTLFGISSGIPYYATGDLPAPIPEPATLALLGIGALMTLARKETKAA
jgi:hypothetical protein